RTAILKQLAKVDLLYIDDFGLAPLADQSKRDLLEILEHRYDKKSTLITSQLPGDQWHAYIDEPTLADAILDRLVHNSHRVVLKGGSMRKHKREIVAASGRQSTHPPQSRHPGDPGRHAPESMAGISRNHWPTSAEYADPAASVYS